MCFSRATDGASFLTAPCQTIGKGEEHCQWPAANVKRQADPSCSLSISFFSLTPSSFDFCLFKILSASHENHLYRKYLNCGIFYATLKYMKYLKWFRYISKVMSRNMSLLRDMVYLKLHCLVLNLAINHARKFPFSTRNNNYLLYR